MPRYIPDLRIMIGRHADECLGISAVCIGPTVGPAVWTLGTPASRSPLAPAPTLRRELVNPPFRKPPRLTDARDTSVHVPRLSEFTGRNRPD